MAQGPFVGVFSGIHVGEVARHPIVRTATWRGAFFERIRPVSRGLAANAQPFQFLRGHFGDVHVQACALGRAFLQHFLRDRTDRPAGAPEVGVLGKVAQRKPHGGDAFQRPFHRGAHRARVDDVDRAVAPVVDAAEQDVWLPVQNLVDGQLDAVDRRARRFVRSHTLHAKVVRPHFQDVADGDRVAHA